MMLDTRLEAIILSRGSVWNPYSASPPYLGAAPGFPWPTGTASAVFYDTAGVTLATIDGTVAPDEITFLQTPDVMDAIPAGAKYEIFLTTDDGPYQIRYGTVLRREVTFPDSPANTSTFVPLQFADSFPTLGLSSKWVAINNGSQVHDNSGASLPNGVSTQTTFLSILGATSAIRYYTPVNGDSVKVHVSLLNMGSGHTGIVLCANALMTSYLAVVFDHPASGTQVVHLATGSGPNTMTYQGSPVTHTVANGNDYTIGYDDITKILSVYAGTNTTPLATFTDSSHVVPHGPGYRYLAMNWTSGALFSTGIEVSNWAVQDDV